MTAIIYRWTGVSYREYEILKETAKTFTLKTKHSPYPLRIMKKDLDKTISMKGLFSFDRNKVVEAACETLSYNQDRLRILEKEVAAATGIENKDDGNVSKSY